MAGYEKVIGYESVVNELKRIGDAVKSPEKYKKLGAKTPVGLLLNGEPGVGKTTMAKSFIEDTGRKVFVCKKNKPDGEFVKEIVSVFEEAKSNAPSIVFLDDMDKFANEDEKHTDAEEFATVQSCIDDVKNEEVFVIATTNSLRSVPKSLLRSGRFDKVIEVGTPSSKDAEKIVTHYLKDKNISGDIDPQEVAGIMYGKSCADLELVINEAAIYAVFERREQIEMRDVIRACMRVIHEAPEVDTEIDHDILSKIACHEAGHALIGEILEPNSVYLVSVQGRYDDIDGFTKYADVPGYWQSKKHMDNRIIAIFGGRAATEIFYSESDVGCSSDLNRAYRIASRYSEDYGVDGFETYIYNSSEASQELIRKNETYIAFELERFYKEAKKIIRENREVFERVWIALIEQRTLSGKKLRELMAGKNI